MHADLLDRRRELRELSLCGVHFRLLSEGLIDLGQLRCRSPMQFRQRRFLCQQRDCFGQQRACLSQVLCGIGRLLRIFEQPSGLRAQLCDTLPFGGGEQAGDVVEIGLDVVSQRGQFRFGLDLSESLGQQ